MRRKIIKITKEEIDNIFSSAKEQGEYVLNLYRLVFPNWNEIEKLEGFPLCSFETSEYITRKAMDFDKIHHPNVMRGGIWLNHGFSIDRSMKPWTIKQCKFILKKQKRSLCAKK